MSLRTNVTAQRKRNISSGDRRRDLEFLKCYHHTNLAGEHVKEEHCCHKTTKTLAHTPAGQSTLVGSQAPHLSIQSHEVPESKILCTPSCRQQHPSSPESQIPFLLSLVASEDDSSGLPPCSLSEPALTWDGFFHHGL